MKTFHGKSSGDFKSLNKKAAFVYTDKDCQGSRMKFGEGGSKGSIALQKDYPTRKKKKNKNL